VAQSSQGSHSAPFPRALVEFFLLAYSDAGDVIFDPFMGSGTTIPERQPAIQQSFVHAGRPHHLDHRQTGKRHAVL
jgi:hypothetical protein